MQRGWYDRKHRRLRDLACGDLRIYLDVEVRRVAWRRCGKVKQEQLAFLADNPFYTKRFAFYVGRRCRASPIRDVAKELRLDWHHAGGSALPVYEYHCNKCNRDVTLTLSIREHETGEIKCPTCGGTSLRPLLSAFMSQTSKKS